MLRTRLFLNLLPFVVIVMAVGAYAMVLFSRLVTTVDETVAGNYRSVLAAQSMRLALASMEREAWMPATTNGPLGNKLFNEQRQRFEVNLAAQAKSDSLPGEKDLNDQLAATYRAFMAAIAQLSGLPDARAQHDVYEQKIVPAVLKMNSLLEQIGNLNHRAIMATSENIQRINRDVSRLMIIGMGIALVLSTYACFRLSRSILQPIQALTRATRELGEGNWDQPVPVISRDELGELALAFNRMAARLQEYRQSTTARIVHLHRTMEATLASFPDPIFVLDRNGAIELRNPAAAELASSLELDSQLPGRLGLLARSSLERGESFLPQSFNEVATYRVRGTEKFYLPRILPMRDKDSALSGVAVVLYDVTRFRLLDAAKTNLVATVSHELKTPLTSVRMTLHILLERTLGALNAKQEELLQVARNDTERLLRILNDLLDLARLEEGNADLRCEPVASAELLRQVVEDAAATTGAAGLKVSWTAEPDLPSVSVDVQRIRHVFTNLVTNAIKHSPPGGEIQLRAVPAADGDVRFTVTDQGPGVPEEYEARIFDRFFRVPGQTKTGAGLGLSIAREITVAHGGRIGVKSKPGQGSTFYVVLKAVEKKVIESVNQ